MMSVSTLQEFYLSGFFFHLVSSLSVSLSFNRSAAPFFFLIAADRLKDRETDSEDEPTWRCHQNPFIGALGIQEPVMPGEPLIEG